MFVSWLLCLFLMLIIPVLTLQTGYLRLRKCADMDAERGYRTALSLSSPKAWAFAQKASSVRYMVTGFVMAVLSVLIARALPYDNLLNLYIFTGTIILFQTAVVIVLISTVESGLRALLGLKKEQ